MERDSWILAEKRGPAGIITINRPDAFNAWDRGMLLRAEHMILGRRGSGWPSPSDIRPRRRRRKPWRARPLLLESF